jgi:hypothetical protein
VRCRWTVGITLAEHRRQIAAQRPQDMRLHERQLLVAKVPCANHRPEAHRPLFHALISDGLEAAYLHSVVCRKRKDPCLSQGLFAVLWLLMLAQR